MENIANPNKDLVIPEWVNLSYFENIIHNDVPEIKKIKNFNAVAATAPGENFTSLLLRISVDLRFKDGSTKMKKYIVKTVLPNKETAKVFERSAIFPKEIAIYEKYILGFETLYQNVGLNIKFAPKCLFIEQSKERMTLVLEDLTEQNFRNVNRLTRMNKEHTTRTLEKLAEYHAATAVYEEQNGSYPDKFQFGFFTSSDMDIVRKIYCGRIDHYKKAMKMWRIDDREDSIQKFPTFEQVWKSIECNLEKNEFFNVLAHGDFWTSNIMFDYKPDGNINELIFLDFQFCKWGSPVPDLLYCIGISANVDIHVKEFDKFIAIYHKRLIECLKILKYKKRLPKLRELHQQIYDKSNSFYAFFLLFNHIIINLLPPEEKANISLMLRNDKDAQDFKKCALGNPIFVQTAENLYQFYRQRGILNFEDFE